MTVVEEIARLEVWWHLRILAATFLELGVLLKMLLLWHCGPVDIAQSGLGRESRTEEVGGQGHDEGGVQPPAAQA